MTKHKFDDEVEANVIEIKSQLNGTVYTEDGISTHSKFLLLDMPKNKKNEYPRIIFQNLTSGEKEELFELLDKELHDPSETSPRLIERAAIAEYKLDELGIGIPVQ